MDSELTRVQRALAVAENARLKAKSERGVAQEALAVAGKACRKAEEENSRLADERLALVMELSTIKDDFAAFREKVVVDRVSMEAEFDASGDMLFNYGYGCLMSLKVIYFQSIFLIDFYIKRLIYMQEYGIT